MELAIGLIVIVGIGCVLYYRSQQAKQVEETPAPYKLETPKEEVVVKPVEQPVVVESAVETSPVTVAPVTTEKPKKKASKPKTAKPKAPAKTKSAKKPKMTVAK